MNDDKNAEENQKQLLLLRKALLVIQKCEGMLEDVEVALGATYDDAGLKAFRCRVECQINDLTGEECPYCEEDDFYTGEWKVPEGIPYMCLYPIKPFKDKLRIIE